MEVPVVNPIPVVGQQSFFQRFHKGQFWQWRLEEQMREISWREALCAWPRLLKDAIGLKVLNFSFVILLCAGIHLLQRRSTAIVCRFIQDSQPVEVG